MDARRSAVAVFLLGLATVVGCDASPITRPSTAGSTAPGSAGATSPSLAPPSPTTVRTPTLTQDPAATPHPLATGVSEDAGTWAPVEGSALLPADPLVFSSPDRLLLVEEPFVKYETDRCKLATGDTRGSPAALVTVADGTVSTMRRIGLPPETAWWGALQDGRLLAIGGIDPRGVDETEWPEGRTWTWHGGRHGWVERGRMIDRWDQDGVILPLADGRVLAVGSASRGEVFDPKTNRWSKAGRFPRAENTELLSLTQLEEGQVLALGQFYDTLHAAYLFDPADLSWHRTVDPPDLSSDHEVVAMPDGSAVLFTGGYWSEEITEPQAFRFDLREGWSAIATPRATWGAAIAVLADGLILIAGGEQDGPPVQTAALFDPVTGRAHTIADMPVGRTRGVAQAAGDGSVVIVGGWPRQGGLGDACLPGAYRAIRWTP